ncbi:MAG: sugar phosphate isomerase/epimerase [Verrucomicrobiales bacterium]
MLALSTCWNSSRHTEGEELVQEIIEMGFDWIEVSHGLKISLLPGILKMAEAGKIKVCGLHNFCPSPVEVMIDAPDAYEFTSHRAFDRSRALDLTFKTIEMATRFGAGYVVVHMGSVPVAKFTRKLEDLAKAGAIHDREFVRLKLDMIRKRERIAPLYLKRAREALEQLGEQAEKHGVKIAVESRSAYEDVPNEREMELIMEEFAGPHIGYWHDFGHVQRKANLAVLDHGDWLGRMAKYLIGCHVHDVEWPARDHRVPLTAGGVDFPNLMEFVPKGAPLVWELSPRRRKETVLAQLPKWLELYGAWG